MDLSIKSSPMSEQLQAADVSFFSVIGGGVRVVSHADLNSATKLRLPISKYPGRDFERFSAFHQRFDAGQRTDFKCKTKISARSWIWP